MKSATWCCINLISGKVHVDKEFRYPTIENQIAHLLADTQAEPNHDEEGGRVLGGRAAGNDLLPALN
jgi:hypothetical protein